MRSVYLGGGEGEGGAKHNVFPCFDVKDNPYFIMMSFRCHICQSRSYPELVNWHC